MRARVYCVSGENPTIKFNCDLMKYASMNIHVIVRKDPLYILELFRRFHEQLYAKEDVDDGLQKSLLDNIGIPSKSRTINVGLLPLNCQERNNVVK